MKTALDVLKLPPRYFVTATILAAFLLFSDPETLKQFGAFEFASEYRKYIGIVFLASAALSINGILGYFGRSTQSLVRAREIKKRLNALTEPEKQILRYYIAKETRTNYLYMYDGIVEGLKAAGILTPAAERGPPTCYPYNITDEAWNYLKKNRHLLLGETDYWRNDQERHPVDLLREYAGHNAPR